MWRMTSMDDFKNAWACHTAKSWLQKSAITFCQNCSDSENWKEIKQYTEGPEEIKYISKEIKYLGLWFFCWFLEAPKHMGPGCVGTLPHSQSDSESDNSQDDLKISTGWRIEEHLTLVLPGGTDEDKASKIIRQFKLAERVQEGVLRWHLHGESKCSQKQQILASGWELALMFPTFRNKWFKLSPGPSLLSLISWHRGAWSTWDVRHT